MRIDTIGIIGAGGIGRKHISVVGSYRPRTKIVSIRHNPDLNVNADSGAIVEVQNIQQAIDLKIQAAVVCSPASMHVSQAIELLNSNIPVLVEKPLSSTLTEASRVIDIDDRSTEAFLLGYCLRHTQGLNLVKSYLDDARLGRILHARIYCSSYLPNWRPERDYRSTASSSLSFGGGALLELSHEIDYANWLFGPLDKLVANLCQSKALDIDVEDAVDVIVINQAGVPINIHLDFCSHRGCRECIIEGVLGDVHWDLVSGRVTWRSLDGIKEVTEFSADVESSFHRQMVHFFDCVENGVQPIVTLQDGCDVLKIIEAIRMSEKGRKWVEIL